MQNHTCRTALTALLIFSLMFALNYFMPLHRDDYDYSMIWHTGVHITTCIRLAPAPLFRARRAHGLLLLP